MSTLRHTQRQYLVEFSAGVNTYYALCKEDQNNFQASILRCPMQGGNMDSIAYSIGEGTFELLTIFCILFTSLRRCSPRPFIFEACQTKVIESHKLESRPGPMPQTCPSRDFEISQSDHCVPGRPVRGVSRRMERRHLLKKRNA